MGASGVVFDGCVEHGGWAACPSEAWEALGVLLRLNRNKAYCKRIADRRSGWVGGWAALPLPPLSPGKPGKPERSEGGVYQEKKARGQT